MTLSECTKADLLWIIKRMQQRYLHDGVYAVQRALGDLDLEKARQRYDMEQADGAGFIGGRLMLIITIKVDAPAGQAIGIKEDLAMYLERFGDSRVVSVEKVTPQQMSLMDKG